MILFFLINKKFINTFLIKKYSYKRVYNGNISFLWIDNYIISLVFFFLKKEFKSHLSMAKKLLLEPKFYVELSFSYFVSS